MRRFAVFVLLLLPLAFLPVAAKKKKTDEQLTQQLPVPPELPSAVAVETRRLVFYDAPLSNKGLLSQQVRDGLKALLRLHHNSSIVQIRAFVAGTGDMRRVPAIVSEVFTDKKLALPVITTVQVGALALDGAQVALESTGADRRILHSQGIAFLSGQAGSSLEDSLEKLRAALTGSDLEGPDVLRVTCFVRSLEESRNAQRTVEAAFSNAAVSVVQMQRAPANPASECEAVASMRIAVEGVKLVNPQSLAAAPAYSQVALVSAQKLVFTGMQMAFGPEEKDFKLAFERLGRALKQLNTNFPRLVMSHTYLTSRSLIDRLRTVRAGYYDADRPPASTLLPFEALPSLDAPIGIDVVASSDN